MDNKDRRQQLHNKRWGNWRYDANNDTLVWDKAKEWPYDIPRPESVDEALRQIAHMAQKRYKEQDMKDLAKAFSDLLQCPGLANAYDTRYHTLRESKDKVLKDSGSACDNCAPRFGCYSE